MSDERSPRPGGVSGIRPGNVPVLALLAAAALASVVFLNREEVPARPTANPTATAAVPHITAPAPPVEPAPVPEPASEPPAPEPPAPEPVAQEPPTPPPPAVAVEVLLPGLRAALAGIRCADLRVEAVEGALRVTGTVTRVDDGYRVQQLLDALPTGPNRTATVTVAPAALCEPLLLLEPLRAANAGRAAPLSVAAVDGDQELSGGQDLVLDIRAGDAGGPVQVDYFTVDGTVVHLLPNPMEPAPRLEAGSARRLGERDGRARFWTIGPPFGQELIVVVAGGAPLFAAPRPEAEPAAAYLPELKRALAEAEGAVAATLFITTRAP